MHRSGRTRSHYTKQSKRPAEFGFISQLKGMTDGLDMLSNERDGYHFCVRPGLPLCFKMEPAAERVEKVTTSTSALIDDPSDDVGPFSRSHVSDLQSPSFGNSVHKSTTSNANYLDPIPSSPTVSAPADLTHMFKVSGNKSKDSPLGAPAMALMAQSLQSLASTQINKPTSNLTSLELVSAVDPARKEDSISERNSVAGKYTTRSPRP